MYKHANTYPYWTLSIGRGLLQSFGDFCPSKPSCAKINGKGRLREIRIRGTLGQILPSGVGVQLLPVSVYKAPTSATSLIDILCFPDQLSMQWTV